MQRAERFRAILAVALFLVAIDSVNVLSTLHDARGAGRTLAVWKPVVGEFSSGVGMLVSCGLIYVALWFAEPGRASWSRLVRVHGPATLGFSGLHIAIMMGLRVLIYAAQGLRYRPPLPANLLYEYRKDVLAYVIIAGIFWVTRHWTALNEVRPVAATPADGPPPMEAAIEIVDGARIVRTPVHCILAVRAASNYVEYLLDDGRRPLTRASLSASEQMLAKHGFVRTHRSWIVNPARLRSLEAVGSGDHRLQLDTGVEAPLSRRFRGEIVKLRVPGSSGVT